MVMGNILSQEEYLCSEEWPKKSVNLLIETLSGESLYGEWDYADNMTKGITNAIGALKREFGVTYSSDQVRQAISLLHERYTVWKKILADKQVFVNKWSKRVSAQPSVWERMIKDDERVKWYGHEGEKAYDDLEVIFENPFKGKEGYVSLGEMATPNYTAIPLDQVQLSPLPPYPTPPRGRAFFDEPSPIRNVENQTANLGFSPNPTGSPSLRVISREDFERSMSGKKSKNQRRLFVTPNSPISSVGSSTNPIVPNFEALWAKFDKSG